MAGLGIAGNMETKMPLLVKTEVMEAIEGTWDVLSEWTLRPLLEDSVHQVGEKTRGTSWSWHMGFVVDIGWEA